MDSLDYSLESIILRKKIKFSYIEKNSRLTWAN